MKNVKKCSVTVCHIFTLKWQNYGNNLPLNMAAKKAQNASVWLVLGFFAYVVLGSNPSLSALKVAEHKALTGFSVLGLAIMAKKWQAKVYKGMSIPKNKEKRPFKPPFLSKPLDNDLKKQWCIEYGVWSESDAKIKRKRVVVTGNTVAERLQTANEIIAELTALLEKGAYLRAEKPPAPKRVASPSALSFTDAIDKYLASIKTTLEEGTFTRYRSTLIYSFSAFLTRHSLQNSCLKDFTRADALLYLDEIKTVENNSNRTRNNRKGDMNSFFRYFIDRDRTGTLIKSPFADIPKLPYNKLKHNAYTQKQRKVFQDYIISKGDNQLLLFVQFIYYTFLRPGSELRNLKVGDILETTIKVHAENAKDNETEYVVIPAPLQELISNAYIRQYPEDFYVFGNNRAPGPIRMARNTMYMRHKKVLKALGLFGKHDLYSWKHTGAVALWDATHDIETVRRQCRHSDIKQTIEYMRDLGKLIDTAGLVNKFPVF